MLIVSILNLIKHRIIMIKIMPIKIQWLCYTNNDNNNDDHEDNGDHDDDHDDDHNDDHDNDLDDVDDH